MVLAAFRLLKQPATIKTPPAGSATGQLCLISNQEKQGDGPLGYSSLGCLAVRREGTDSPLLLLSCLSHVFCVWCHSHLTFSHSSAARWLGIISLLAPTLSLPLPLSVILFWGINTSNCVFIFLSVQLTFLCFVFFFLDFFFSRLICPKGTFLLL